MSPIRHVGLRGSMSRFSMGLQSGMSVSDVACRGLRSCRSPMKHVEVSDQVCRSPMKHVDVSDGSPIIIIFS